MKTATPTRERVRESNLDRYLASVRRGAMRRRKKPIEAADKDTITRAAKIVGLPIDPSAPPPGSILEWFRDSKEF